MSVNNINGMIGPLYRQNVTANNVANVNTPGFQPAGVQSTSTGSGSASGAAYINSVGQGGSAASPTASTYGPPRASATALAAPTPSPTPTAAPQMSNVDMIAETANRMGAQNAYNMNAAAAQSMNGMTQTLMDMVG